MNYVGRKKQFPEKCKPSGPLQKGRKQFKSGVAFFLAWGVCFLATFAGMGGLALAASSPGGYWRMTDIAQEGGQFTADKKQFWQNKMLIGPNKIGYENIGDYGKFFPWKSEVSWNDPPKILIPKQKSKFAGTARRISCPDPSAIGYLSQSLKINASPERRAWSSGHNWSILNVGVNCKSKETESQIVEWDPPEKTGTAKLVIVATAYPDDSNYQKFYIYEWAEGTSPNTGDVPGNVTDTKQPGAGQTTSGPVGPCPGPTDGMSLQVCRYAAKPGETVSVPVWLTKGRDVANMTFDLTYDQKVAQAENDLRKGELLPKNSPLASNMANTGTVSVGLTAPTGVSISGSGQMLTIPFKVTGQPGQKTALRLNVRQVKTLAQQTPSLAVVHGEIAIIGAGTTSGPPPTPPQVAVTPPGTKPGLATPPGPGPTAPPDPKVKANCCGHSCDLKDALKALQMAVYKLPPELCLDLDKNKQIDSNDAWLIFKAY